MRHMENLLGRRFGRLTVIGDAERHGYVVCRCDCGSLTTIRRGSLTKSLNPTRSCGCLHREAVSKTGKRTINDNARARREETAIYGTNFGIIENNKADPRNKSGRKGVWYNAARGCYIAYISLRNRRIHLGYYTNLQDAIDAREKAEAELYAPIIAAKNAAGRDRGE